MAVPEKFKPVAVAGPDQIVPVGQEVLLDGRGSTNPAGTPDLSYHWSLLDQPYFSGTFLLEWDQAVTYFIPDLPGRYYLELDVSDGRSSTSDSAIITAKVLNPGNRAPVLTQVTPAAEMIALSFGQEVDFSVTADDPDGDQMVFNWYVNDAFTFSGPDFVFLAGTEQVGQAVAVRVVVSDGDKTASHDWVVTVSQANSGGNSPPAFTPVPDQTVSEGNSLTFVIRALDPDGDPVSYFASLLPAGAVFFKETGKFLWTPDYDQAGHYISHCEFPKDLLNDGRYILGVNASSYRIRRYFMDEQALAFNVDTSGAPGMQWSEPRPGALRPRLEWKIETV